jgi:hypothetical protein
MLGTTAEQLPKSAKNWPDTAVETTTIWVDPTDFLIFRSEDDHIMLRDGEIWYTFNDTAEYSDYGTAELPGPLPDA